MPPRNGTAIRRGNKARRYCGKQSYTAIRLGKQSYTAFCLGRQSHTAFCLQKGCRSCFALPLDLLTAKRDAEAAKRFLRRTLQAIYTSCPRVINVDKNVAYPKAIDELKEKEKLAMSVELRQNKYLNNIIEQDHRGIKRLVRSGMGFGSFNTAKRTPRDMKS